MGSLLLPSSGTKEKVPLGRPSVEASTLLDETGRLGSAVPYSDTAGWKERLKREQLSDPERARLHLRLGEVALGGEEAAEAAAWHFRSALRFAPSDQTGFLARYGSNVVLARRGAYTEAQKGFDRLLKDGALSKSFPAFVRARSALWLRHVSARQGYRDRLAALGIPQPEHLDPLCGVRALQTTLAGLEDDQSLATLREKCQPTGLGSSLEDLRLGAEKLGYSAFSIATTEEGLKALPKPVVAFVQDDHFVAVVNTDEEGVTYRCSDCGPSLAGGMKLTWKQWRAMKPGAFLSVVERGSEEASAIAMSLPSDARATDGNRKVQNILFARPSGASRPLGRGARLAARLRGRVAQVYTGPNCGWWRNPARGAVPHQDTTDGDPVNLATGEEQYLAAPDMVVYNPKGPNVVWRRKYYSMKPNVGSSPASSWTESNNINYFGAGWSYNYNTSVFDPDLRPIPQITKGTGMSLKNLDLDDPAAGQTWDVIKDGISVATSSVPNGWSVAGLSSLGCYVTPPSSLGQNSGYRVRWKELNYSGHALFDILDPREVRQDSSSSFTYDGTDLPTTPGESWDITLNGTVVASRDTPNGWTRADVSGQSNQVNVGAPSHAVVSSAYKLRYGYPWTGGFSATFSVLPGRPMINASMKHLILPTNQNVEITPAGVPSASTPDVACVVEAGVPMIVTWHYEAGNPFGYYTVRHNDGSTWTMRPWRRYPGSTWIGYCLTREADSFGNWIGFNYTSSAGANAEWFPYLTSIVDSAGSPLLTLTRNPSAAYGGLGSISDRYGRSVYYTHNPTSYGTVAPGSLSTVSQVVLTGTTNPPLAESLGYNSQFGIVNSITKPSPSGTGTAATTIEYDATTGYATAQVDANGNRREYTKVGSSSTLVTVKDALSNTVASNTVHFDSRLNNIGSTDGSNSTLVLSMAYEDTNNPDKPTKATDGDGRIARRTYNARGDVLTTKSAKGTITTYTYNYSAFPLGRLTSIQEGTKSATTFTYFEPSGALQTITAPTAAGTMGTTSFTYDGLGNVLTVAAPGNQATATRTMTFNYTTDGTYAQAAALGQPLTAISHLGYQKHFRYDAQGRTTAKWDALGNTTDCAYNLSGRILSVTAPATGQTGTGRARAEFSYAHPNGPELTKALFDESNTLYRTVTRSFGPTGELLGTSGNLLSTTYAYDADYRTTAFTDGKGQTTSYTYNARGYRASTTLPGGETTTFDSYSYGGALLQKTDPRGTVTSYTYADPNGDLTAVQSAGAPAENVSYAYDDYGRVATKADGSGSTAYSYGDADELLSEVTTYTGLAAKTIGYSYNKDGSRLGMLTPAGGFGYAYDADGRLTGVTNPNSETTAYAYLNNGWLWKTTSANGLLATRTYNAAGQLTNLANTLSNTGISQFGSIAYNAAGQIASVTATIPGYAAYSGTTGYTYDTKDQVTQETSSRAGGFTGGYGYDNAGNLTTFKGATRSYDVKNRLVATGFAYDNNGNPTTYNGATATYDRDDRLTSIGTLTAGYNSDGLRTWKQSGGSRTYFLYDGETPVCELDASGNVVATNTFGGDGLVSRRSAGTTVFYTSDHAGGTAERVDAAGAILSHHIHDAYGTTLSSAATTDPYRGFGARVGYRIDDETGFRLLGRRYFDPATGRFVTRDPIGHQGGPNLYAYCSGDPVNLLDPSGLDPSVGWEFSESVWANGLATGTAAAANVFTWGHVKDCWAEQQEGYGGAVAIGTFGREVGFQAVTMGAGTAISGARAGAIAAQAGRGVQLGKAGANVVASGGAVKVAASGFLNGGEHGMMAYNALTKIIRGTGLQAHHIIEKRFAAAMGEKGREMLAIALTPAEHQVFTNAWRQAIPYGTTATRQQVKEAAQQIYKNHPAILKALGL